MWRAIYPLYMSGQKQVKPRKVRRFRQLSSRLTTALVRIYATVSRFPMRNSLIVGINVIKYHYLRGTFRLNFRDYILDYS